MNAHLRDAVTDRFRVAGKTAGQPLDTREDSASCGYVFQLGEPLGELAGFANLDHSEYRIPWDTYCQDGEEGKTSLSGWKPQSARLSDTSGTRALPGAFVESQVSKSAKPGALANLDHSAYRIP